MWRKVCLILSVLGGHLALLGWLQLAPDHDVAVAPTLRFQLAPAGQPIRPVAPALAPTPLASPLPSVANKVKKPVLVAAQTPTSTVHPAATNKTVSAPTTSLESGLGFADKTGETELARSAQAGAATSASTTPAASTTMVLPSSTAAYLNNPAPVYPAISRRLGEQGRVVVRVLINKDGKPQQGEIGQSSGNNRLDQAALRAVMEWRYVPGRRDGTAQDMWFNVPINFALQ